MGSFSTLCATHWSCYVLDIVAVIFVIIYVIVCGGKGFFKCLLGIVSSLVAFILAISLAGTVLKWTGGLFGLEGLLATKFQGVFSGMEGFNADISGSGVEAALKEQNVSAIMAQLILKMTDKGETIAAGTTLAQLLGKATASLAGSLISGVVIFILIKLVVFLLKKVFDGIAKKIKPIKKIDTLLGSIFGLLYSTVIISLILAVLAVIPAAAIGTYFSKTIFLGMLFEHNPLVYMLGWFL